MSLCFFEGPAGSGKTTRLFEELAKTLDVHPLDEHQRILALTKMHGARRRMQRRLAALPGLRGRFDCTTIDSFAWRMIRRWRGLCRSKGSAELAHDDYDQVCACAGTLLSGTVVRNWATGTFPLVVIDEMQDSKGGQLEIIRALAESATCIAAADGYQDLEATNTNEAVSWAQQAGRRVPLTHNRRTSAVGLLAAASALREGHGMPENGGGFTVLGALNKNVAASYVSTNLTWWQASDDIAVITPVRPGTSPFVRDLIDRVEEKPIGNPAVGPHRIPWEVSQEDEYEQFVRGLGLPAEADTAVCASDIRMNDEHGVARALRDWLDRQRRVGGRTTFNVKDIHQQTLRIYQRSRAHRRIRDRGVRAMTIHQAKNREFDSVIVLWPYEVVGSSDRQRRLLYNGITRAKRQALVIVQNPDRLGHPPFVPDA